MRLAACQRDSAARSLDTEVLAVEEVVGGWRVQLADTVLYPEGGGQPADHGLIAGVPVRDVQRQGDRVWHTTDAAVPFGPVRVEVDWTRRWDHMQQHSGQHLLTAVAQQLLGRETLAFHLGQDSCTIDLDGALSAPDLERLEEAVNDEIRASRPLGWREVDRGELEGLGVRSRGLPEHVTGPIRLVEIEGLDLNTCGGTHVQDTGQLQVLHLLAADKHKGGSRLSFLVGGRVLHHLGLGRARERELTLLLRQGPEAHATEVARLLEAGRAEARDKRSLMARLGALEGAALAARPEGSLWHHLPEADLGLLRQVAQLARGSHPERTVILTGGELGDSGVFMVAGPATEVAALGPRVAEAVQGRGGGRGEIYQGQAACLVDLSALLTA